MEPNKPYKYEFGHGTCSAHFVTNCPACGNGGAPEGTTDSSAGFELVDGKLQPRRSALENPAGFELGYGEQKLTTGTLTTGVIGVMTPCDPIVTAAREFADAQSRSVRFRRMLSEAKAGLEKSLQDEAECKKKMTTLLAGVGNESNS